MECPTLSTLLCNCHTFSICELHPAADAVACNSAPFKVIVIIELAVQLHAQG